MSRSGDRHGCRRDAATLVPVLTLLLALQGGPAPRAVEFTVGNVTVVTVPRLEPLGRRLGAVAAAPQQWLGLGRIALGPITLAIVPDRTTFQRWSRGRLPSWGAGMALPNSGMVLLRADGGDVDVTLRHELAHVALHRKVKVRVPLWFDEGYAVLASREYGGLAALQLNLAVAAGRVPTLAALDASLRGSEGDATAAYALAASAVAELGRRHPTGHARSAPPAAGGGHPLRGGGAGHDRPQRGPICRHMALGDPSAVQLGNLAGDGWGLGGAGTAPGLGQGVSSAPRCTAAGGTQRGLEPTAG
ncbi:MAG: hypothetical protein IPJ11_09950 [Gemmatimonadetes bacterium]|nr:hypothetical protein [Gemmatimonadota bacterium]